MHLSGWQAVAGLVVGGALSVAGVMLPNGAPLLTLGGAVIGGILGVSQPWRSPAARTRASDRPGELDKR